MKRLSFRDVEVICERQNCRFNDLFLIGNDVFVMVDSENWRLPSNYRPLLLDDPEVTSALADVLRRLDATEFESKEAFERARAYNAVHAAEFERLKYELYDLLTAANHEHEAPEGGQFYLELEGTSAEDVLLVCDAPSSLDATLIASIQETLRGGSYALSWRVRASFENGAATITISKDALEHAN